MTSIGTPADANEHLSVEERRTHRRQLAYLIACLVGVHACMASSRVAASLWALASGHGEWTVGVLLGLYSVGPLTLALCAGRMADRHGFQRPMRISVLLALAGTLPAGLMPQLATLVASALLTGAAACLAEVAVQRTAGRLVQRAGALQRVFSWIALASALSNTISPIVIGIAIDHGGYQPAFLFAAVLPLVAGWCMHKVRGAPVTPSSNEASPRGAVHLLRLKPLRTLLALNLALAASWDVHLFAVPVIAHERQLSASSVGWILGACSMGAIAVRVLIARWGDRLDERRALRGVALVTLTTLIVYAWLPATWGLMLGSAVIGVAIGAMQPLVLSAMFKAVPPDQHGQALGLRVFSTSGATAGMPVIFGALAAASTVAAPLWLMAALVALAACLSSA